MTDVLRPPPAQFLRVDAIRGGMDLLLFAHKSHVQRSDEELEKLGFGHAQHRILYFLARQPELSVGGLLALLQVRKQYLGRVLNPLIRTGYVEQNPCKRDKRRRLLRLTAEGHALEHRLFIQLQANMERAYAAAGEDAVNGFWILMQHLMTPEIHQHFVAFQRSTGSQTPL
jgi:DNA-binding MarR family transcriptional regulator